MSRVTRGEAAIAAYVDSVRERDSLKVAIANDGETSTRVTALKLAESRVKLCYAALNGGQLGEARRRLARAVPLELENPDVIPFAR